MGIEHAPTDRATESDYEAPHVVGVIEASEQATPSTPSSGTSLLYPKDDGRWYSMGDDGVERGPFDSGGGADLSAYRLTGIKDSPSDLALGEYGDEFEYASLDDFEAVWVPSNGASGTFADKFKFLGGSDIAFDTESIGGRGFVRNTGTLPDDFEVAALMSWGSILGVGSMAGIGISNGTSGIASVHYDTCYQCRINSTHTYNGFNAGSGTPPDYDPFWMALRRLAGKWRTRWSTNGTGWTTADNESAGTAYPVTGADRIFIGGAYTNRHMARYHRVVYGEPDLGLG